MSLSGKPVLILRDNTERVRGKNALKINIEAVKAVAEAIRTILGPKGMNKMIVDNLGDITISKDSTLLGDLAIENPAAKMIVDLSKSIYKNVGDGSTSAVIFIGELMKRVEEMLSMDIAPTLIYEGFSNAVNECKSHLAEMALDIDLKDKKTLVQAAKTALSSKSLADSKDLFAQMIVDTIQSIQETRGEKTIIDMDNIQIIKKEGAGMNSSKLINGIIVDKEVVNPVMPKLMKDAKVALIDGALEVIKTDFTAEIQISNPDEITSYLKKEESLIKELIDALIAAGTNVVFCQKGIDEMAQHFMAKNNIMAIRRVKHSDMKKLSQATGASIITRIKDIKPEDLGNAGVISEHKIGKDNMIFVEKCLQPKSVTLLLRGGTEIVVDVIERAVKNGLSVVKSLVETPKFVGGSGSSEMELSRHIREMARKIGGKEQIVYEQYAEALEIIPKVLVENSGTDPLDIITSLRSQVNYSKKQYMGYDNFKNLIVDTVKEGIIEPLAIKKQILSLATELAVVFVRIDDYIRATG